MFPHKKVMNMFRKKPLKLAEYAAFAQLKKAEHNYNSIMSKRK
jgi:hypothetical protein